VINKQNHLKMNLKSTEELQDIISENDRDQYSDETFEAIKDVLKQRRDNLPGHKKRYGLIPINSISEVNPMIKLSIVGAVFSGILAFLLRPSAPFIGQLPFEIVILRGFNLKGLDQLLIPLAQKSFNMMVTGVIIGAIIGACIGYFVKARKVN
jgi:hypothetical protein